MATILEFRPQARSANMRAPAAVADVVFFTGVRYERRDDDEPRGDVSPPKRRDVIEAHDDRD